MIIGKNLDEAKTIKNSDIARELRWSRLFYPHSTNALA